MARGVGGGARDGAGPQDVMTPTPTPSRRRGDGPHGGQTDGPVGTGGGGSHRSDLASSEGHRDILTGTVQRLRLAFSRVVFRVPCNHLTLRASV